MFVLKRIRAYGEAGKTALVNRGDSLSFQSLDARSEAFSAWLLKEFGEDRSPVVIYGHKETDFLPCVFGALKAGRAYVPVDTVTPPGRAAEIIREIKPKVVADFSESRLEADKAVLRADALRGILNTPAETKVPESLWVSGDEAAYILFTSGSTGRPKGVPITANNLTQFYEGLRPFLEGEEGFILNQVSYSFDVSCCSVYAGLSQGMTLFTVDSEMVEDMGKLYASLGASGLTAWVSTPSFAELCVRSRSFTAGLLPHLRRFLFCGEVLTHKLCDELSERFPDAEILNTYGPTEATVLVTAVKVTEEMRRDSQSIPIGYPLREVELRLVDREGKTVAGEDGAGELHILGGSVGPGYLGSPDLTAKRFYEDEKIGKRGYRTGDICFRKGGLYYYQGRGDNQIKLSGHRIELEDVESNLIRIDNIARAAVIPVRAEGQVQYLAAFLLLEQEDGLTSLKRSMAIKRRAAELLPAYMIPRKFIVVEEFPLNTSGKVDRKALEGRLHQGDAI